MDSLPLELISVIFGQAHFTSALSYILTSTQFFQMMGIFFHKIRFRINYRTKPGEDLRITVSQTKYKDPGDYLCFHNMTWTVGDFWVCEVYLPKNKTVYYSYSCLSYGNLRREDLSYYYKRLLVIDDVPYQICDGWDIPIPLICYDFTLKFKRICAEWNLVTVVDYVEKTKTTYFPHNSKWYPVDCSQESDSESSGPPRCGFTICLDSYFKCGTIWKVGGQSLLAFGGKDLYLVQHSQEHVIHHLFSCSKKSLPNEWFLDMVAVEDKLLTIQDKGAIQLWGKNDKGFCLERSVQTGAPNAYYFVTHQEKKLIFGSYQKSMHFGKPPNWYQRLDDNLEIIEGRNELVLEIEKEIEQTAPSSPGREIPVRNDEDQQPRKDVGPSHVVDWEKFYIPVWGGLAAVAHSCNVVIFDPISWKIVSILQGHRLEVLSAVFSENSSLLVTGDANYLRVWNSHYRCVAMVRLPGEGLAKVLLCDVSEIICCFISGVYTLDLNDIKVKELNKP